MLWIGHCLPLVTCETVSTLIYNMCFYVCKLLPKNQNESSIWTELIVFHNISFSPIPFSVASILDVWCSRLLILSEACSIKMAPWILSLCLLFCTNTSGCLCVCVLCRLCCQRRSLRWWSGPPNVQSSGWMEISSVALSRLLPETTLW